MYAKITALTLLVFNLLILSACAGYTSESDAYLQPYKRGQVNKAAKAVTQLASGKKVTRNRVLLKLEEGRTLHAAGQYEKSNQAFEEADRLMREYNQQAQVKISNETGAIVTNLRTLPYHGRTYDLILANTYKALNYMYLGKFDEARVEFNRAYEAQKIAVKENAKRIAQAKAQVEEDSRNSKAGGVFNISKSLENPELQTKVKSRYQGLGDMSSYADYVNPFTEFLQGLYRTGHGVSESDYEQGLTAFKRVQGMVDNPYLEHEVTMARHMANGGARPKRTYVFFETGLAPRREQIRIDLPLFLVNGEVDYFGAAFPLIKYNQAYVKNLRVTHADQTDITRTLVSMDSVIGREFYNRLPIVITRTLIASAAKAAASYAANEATQHTNVYANVATRVGTTLYQAAMNQADLRTWRTLPKKVQYCSFPTPKNEKITIHGTGLTPRTVKLKDGRMHVVTVNSIQPGDKLIVSQFAFQ